ncbi:MAG: SUMF1/EgtB/PvdO family nonheme iron enzyme [Bacteroidales bacterium]|nr:SUMF1/EgtB/PvdO family nonheme iron enzyme [Bacteroidales bacterium]
MLPTLGQWYYGGCATDTNGGKAANSHYPSPTVMTSTPSTSSSANDAKLNPIAWYYSNSAGSAGSRHIHEVGKKAPNMVGLYDVSGNLWEWCLDWYQSGAYTGGQDGVSVASSSSRVPRGGYWNNSPYYCSLGSRTSYSPGALTYGIGFRAAVAP